MSERMVRKLAQALCDKLHIVHSSVEYKGYWFGAHSHGLIYSGPTYTNELKALDDYLHGEGEKREDDPYKRVFNLDDQPSPTPTRQEWAEWVVRVAQVIAMNVYNTPGGQRDDLERVFLSMPIVPKGG